MEAKLDTLIEKIKNEGIEQSKKSANEILAQAKQEAEQIVAQAQSQAKSIIESANDESESIINRGTDALKQAQRDLLLTVENQLKEIIEKFVAQASHDALSANNLKDIISTALSKWDVSSNDNIFVHLSESDARQITKEMISGAIQSKGASLEIKVDANISSGFRISKGASGNYAFDFTSDAISSALSVFLTPNIQELLK